MEKYPGIIDRVKAIVVDGIVILLLMFAVTYVFSLFVSVADSLRLFAFVFIFILYDPLFTSIFGGTIGHFMLGLQVKRDSDQGMNISFHFAIIRYLAKTLLGIISLLTVSGNEKGKAIHDYLVGSIVIFAENREIEKN